MFKNLLEMFLKDQDPCKCLESIERILGKKAYKNWLKWAIIEIDIKLKENEKKGEGDKTHYK